MKKKFFTRFIENMNILPYRYQTIKSSPVNFKSTASFYRLPGGKEVGNNSWMFRDGINWKQTAEYLLENFKNKDMVNVLQIGSSDGSEAFSFIISMLELGVKDVEKFFPMKGYDIDPASVDKARSGKCALRSKDFLRFNELNIDPKKYFTKTNEYLYNGVNLFATSDYDTYSVSGELSKRVDFEQDDMFKIAKGIQDDSNTVLFCRNVMIYFDELLNNRFIEILGQKLKAGSLFVIGKLDEELPYMKSTLEQFGFKSVLKNVYKKIR